MSPSATPSGCMWVDSDCSRDVSRAISCNLVRSRVISGDLRRSRACNPVLAWPRAWHGYLDTCGYSVRPCITGYWILWIQLCRGYTCLRILIHQRYPRYRSQYPDTNRDYPPAPAPTRQPVRPPIRTPSDPSHRPSARPSAAHLPPIEVRAGTVRP